MPHSRAALAAVLALLLVASLHGAAQAPSGGDSKRLLEKVNVITRNGELPQPKPLVTVLTEREVNDYLAFDGRQYLPAGLTGPRVTVLPTGSLSGTAIVDLDAVREHRQSRGMPRTRAA